MHDRDMRPLARTGNHVSIIIVGDPADGGFRPWYRVAIELDGESTVEDVRAAIPTALEWSRALSRWMPKVSEREQLRSRLAAQRSEGRSCLRISEFVNLQIAAHLAEYARDREKEAELTDLTPAERMHRLGSLYTREYFGRRGLRQAQHLLGNLGVNQTDVRRILREALRRLQRGVVPFGSRREPITADRIKEFLRVPQRRKP